MVAVVNSKYCCKKDKIAVTSIILHRAIPVISDNSRGYACKKETRFIVGTIPR